MMILCSFLSFEYIYCVFSIFDSAVCPKKRNNRKKDGFDMTQGCKTNTDRILDELFQKPWHFHCYQNKFSYVVVACGIVETSR